MIAIQELRESQEREEKLSDQVYIFNRHGRVLNCVIVSALVEWTLGRARCKSSGHCQCWKCRSILNVTDVTGYSSVLILGISCPVGRRAGPSERWAWWSNVLALLELANRINLSSSKKYSDLKRAASLLKKQVLFLTLWMLNEITRLVGDCSKVKAWAGVSEYGSQDSKVAHVSKWCVEILIFKTLGV